MLTREFDLGYLVWRRPPAAGSGSMPDLLGSRRVIVDKATGRVYPTGSLPPEAEARQYAGKHAATSRFPMDVRDVLETAGWWPGSHDPPKVTAEFERLSPVSHGWRTGSRFFRADYGLWATDPRWIEHLRPGQVWKTASYDLRGRSYVHSLSDRQRSDGSTERVGTCEST